MPLSPTDFYAYSRATGAPVAETPEERARQAPDVYAFRQMQLQAPQQSDQGGFNVLDALGKTALAAGAIAGGLGLYGRFRGKGLGQAVEGTVESRAAARAAQVAQKTPEVRQTLQKAANAGYGSAEYAALFNEKGFPIDLKLSGPTPPSQRVVAQVAAEPKPNLGVQVTNLNTPVEVQSAAPARQERMVRRQGRLVPLSSVSNRAPLANRSSQSFLTEAIQPSEEILDRLAADHERKTADNIIGQQLGETMVDQHNAETVQHSYQSVSAINSSEDQVTGRSIHALQQNPDVDMSQVGPPSGFNAFSQRATEVGNWHKSVRDMWDLEAMMEDLGQQNQALQAARAKSLYTTNDLLGVLPGQATVTTKAGKARTFVKDYLLSEFSDAVQPTKMSLDIADRISAASNFEEGHPIQQLLLNPNVSTEEVRQYMPDRLLERAGRVGKNLTYEVSPGARASMTDVPTQDEFALRRTAASKYKYGSPEHLALLDYHKPLEEVQHLITQTGVEIHPGYEGSDLAEAYNVHTGNYDSDYMAEHGGLGSQRASDYGQNASDYGDVEGPGGLVETLAFKERTNTGTSMVPGQVSDEVSSRPYAKTRTLSSAQKAQNMLNDTLRQERMADVQIPTRSTPEGDTARGIFVDPETGALSLQGASRRAGSKYQGMLEANDVNVEGSKLVGNFEPTAVPTPGIAVGNNVRVRQDVNKYGGITLKLVRDAGTESPIGGVVYRPGSDVLNIQPYMVNTVVEHEGQKYIVKQPQYGSLVNAKLEPTTVSHSELQEVAQDASNAYFNDPTAKATYLRSQNPEQFDADLASGMRLSDMGQPYDYTGFIAQHLDDYMTNVKKNPLPVLQDISAKHHFVTDVLKTSKDVPMYGKPLGGYYQGSPYPMKDSGTVRLPINQSRGLGGLDPMQAQEGSQENLSYYTPRVDTISQNKLLSEAKHLKGRLQEALEQNPNLDTSKFKVTVPTSSTPTGAEMSALRGAMETPQAGEGMRTVVARDPRTGNVVGTERVSTMNIGSFARTQNPYTGAAAAAMGPAGRVEQGNYQYTPNQLKVLLEPASQNQLLNRNEFAHTANVTPGGRVVRGALNLGQGQGVIPTGMGALSESEVIGRYGVTSGQLKGMGDVLMARAAYKKGLQPGPTSNSAWRF